MPQDDEMQVGVFHAFSGTAISEEGSLPVELGGGEGNLVRIWACHWAIDFINLESDHGAGIDRLIGLGLSSNPEHELTPLVDFQDFQRSQAVYARAQWVFNHRHSSLQNGINWADNEDISVRTVPQLVPLYGLVRPRRQIMVWTLINGTARTGMRLEIYYTPFGATRTEREEVNRKYGKYRRS